MKCAVIVCSVENAACKWVVCIEDFVHFRWCSWMWWTVFTVCIADSVHGYGGPPLHGCVRVLVIAVIGA